MTTSDTYFKTFCRISRSMQKTFEMEKVLDLIVTSAKEAMGAKACSLFLKDEKQKVFTQVAQEGLSDNYIHVKPSQAMNTVKDILTQGGHIYIEDATTDPRIENHEAKKEEGIGSILVVPVISDSITIGILSIYTAQKQEFTPEDIDFLSALADQGGMTIQKARFIDRKQKNAAFFLSIAEDLNSSLDIKHILHIMSAEIAESFNFKGVCIRLIDEEQKELKLVASYGLSEAYMNKGPVYASTLEDCLSNPTEIIEPASRQKIAYFDEKVSEKIATIFNLPVTIKEQIIGVMKVYSENNRKFPEDLVSLLSSVARLGGLAIQNASMYLELQQDKEDLEQEIWSHKAWF